jgi:hypothetical protein
MSSSLYISVQYEAIWNLTTILKYGKGGVFYPLHMTFQTLLLYKCPLINYIPLPFGFSTNTIIISIYIRLLIY